MHGKTTKLTKLCLSPASHAMAAARLGLTTPPAVVAEPKPLAAKETLNKRARLRAEAMAIRAELADTFADVIAAVSWFLFSYASTAAYRRLLQPGAPRVDLDGLVVGVVTEDEAAQS